MRMCALLAPIRVRGEIVTEPIKVLFVNHTATLGGAELSLGRYLNSSSRTIDASLLLLTPDPIDSWGLSNEIRVLSLPKKAHPKALWSTARGIRKGISDVNPHLVVANS